MNTAHVPFNIDDENNPIDPLSIIKQLQRTNRVLINEYESLRHKFGLGKTSLRLLPAHKESRFGWYLPFETYSFDNCPELIRPASLVEQNELDPVIEFKRYLVRYTNLLRQPRENDKDKADLKTKQRAIAWALITKPPETIDSLNSPVALLFGSNNKNGIQGYMAKLYANSTLNSSSSSNNNHNITHPTHGRIIQIEVTAKANSPFNDYKITRGNKPNNLYDLWPKLISKHSQVSKEFIPLESTLNIPTQKELINMLTDYVANQGSTIQKAFRDFISAGSFRHHSHRRDYTQRDSCTKTSNETALLDTSTHSPQKDIPNQKTEEILQAETLCIEFTGAHQSNASSRLAIYTIDEIENALNIAVTHFQHLSEKGAEAVDYLSQLKREEILSDPSQNSQ